MDPQQELNNGTTECITHSQVLHGNRRPNRMRLNRPISQETGSRCLYRGKSTFRFHMWMDETLAAMWLQYLSTPKEAVKCALVCKAWAEAVFSNDSLWQRLFAKRYVRLMRGISSYGDDQKTLIECLPAFTRGENNTEKMMPGERHKDLEWDVTRPIPLFSNCFAVEQSAHSDMLPGDMENVELEHLLSFRMCRWYAATLSLVHFISATQKDITIAISFSCTPFQLEYHGRHTSVAPVELYQGMSLQVADEDLIHSAEEWKAQGAEPPPNLVDASQLVPTTEFLYTHNQSDVPTSRANEAKRSYSFQRSNATLRSDPDILLIGCSNCGKDTITRASSLGFQAWKNEAWLSEIRLSNQWRHFHSERLHGVACTLDNSSQTASLLMSAYENTKHFEGNLVVIDAKIEGKTVQDVVADIDINITFLMEWKIAHYPTVIIANKQDARSRLTPLQIAFLWAWRVEKTLRHKLSGQFSDSSLLNDRVRSLVKTMLQWHAVSGAISLIGYGLNSSVEHFRKVRSSQFDWSLSTDERNKLFQAYEVFHRKYFRRLEVCRYLKNLLSDEKQREEQEEDGDNGMVHYTDESSTDSSSDSECLGGAGTSGNYTARDNHSCNSSLPYNGVLMQVHDFFHHSGLVKSAPRLFEPHLFKEDNAFEPLWGFLPTYNNYNSYSDDLGGGK